MGKSTQGEKAKIIQELRSQGHELKHLLKALGMPKSTYYYEISKTDVIQERDKEITKVIKEIYQHHKGRYGVRRVCQEMRNQVQKINHKRVQRIMHKNGLLGKRPKEKYHSYKGDVGKVADNIIDRDFTTTAPLQKWTTDVSQFNFSWGKCYISPILDMHTNEIIAYDLSMSPNLEQVKRMLARAFKKHKDLCGLIFHSNQGWQYQHADYQKELKSHQCQQARKK